MSKPPPPAPTASAKGPCPTIIKIVGRPGTGSLPSTIAPPDHPLLLCPGTPKLDINDLSDSVDPIRLRTQKQYDKGLHCLTVN